MDDERKDSDLEKVADGIAEKVIQKVVSIEEGKAKAGDKKPASKAAAKKKKARR